MHIYRMSSAGDCPKQLSYERLGYEPKQAPDWLSSAAEEGHWHEKRIKDELLEKGFGVREALVCPICSENGLSRQGLHLEYNHNNLFQLIGHTDGELLNNWKDIADPLLLEIKSMSEQSFSKWKRHEFEEFPSYKSQLACYMCVGNYENCEYIVKNRESGQRLVSHFNINNDTWIREEFQSVLNKITEVENLALSGRLYDAKYDYNSIACRRCYQYKYICEESKKELNEVDKAVISENIQIWRANKHKLEDAKQAIEVCQSIFDEYMTANQLYKIIQDNIIMQKVTVRQTVNYPLANLLKVFSREQLKAAESIREEYSYIKIMEISNSKDEFEREF